MSEATAKYNSYLNSREENQLSCDPQLRSNIHCNSLTQYNDLTLLSKRKARAILKLGSVTLNKLISEGMIKIIMVNGKEKIPYISLQEFIYNMRSKEEYDSEEYKFINEEEANAIANKIFIEINKGDN